MIKRKLVLVRADGVRRNLFVILGDVHLDGLVWTCSAEVFGLSAVLPAALVGRDAASALANAKAYVIEGIERELQGARLFRAAQGDARESTQVLDSARAEIEISAQAIFSDEAPLG